jgi:hypothetical protein
VTFEYFVVAVARTKKQAKQLAAYKMLKRLETSLAGVLNSTVSEKRDMSSEKVCTIIRTFSVTHMHHVSYATVSFLVFLFLSTSLIILSFSVNPLAVPLFFSVFLKEYHFKVNI